MRSRTLPLLLWFALVVGACGQNLEGPPVGDPILPDLVPEPPVELTIKNETDGVSILRFSSTLVNVGEGDFVLKATRPEGGDWEVSQQIAYSESGSDLTRLDAPMIWGGDGHEHWHISRVANYWLEALDEDGNPIPESLGTDTKVGFCFYDSAHPIEDLGPDRYVYDVHGCGEEGDLEVSMGLSPGWSDIYPWSLPGQSVDITNLPDGFYRIWAEADVDGWFVEATTANNLTWVEFELYTNERGRFALISDVGPQPEKKPVD